MKKITIKVAGREHYGGKNLWKVGANSDFELGCSLLLHLLELQDTSWQVFNPFITQKTQEVSTCLLRSTWSTTTGSTWDPATPLLHPLFHVSLRSHWSATENWQGRTLPSDTSPETLITTWQPAAITDVPKVGACHLTGPLSWNILAVC